MRMEEILLEVIILILIKLFSCSKRSILKVMWQEQSFQDWKLTSGYFTLVIYMIRIK